MGVVNRDALSESANGATEFPRGACADAPAGANELPEGRAIVFYDGVCGICNRSVDFALSHDRKGTLLFAPLQGETAARFLNREDLDELRSVVLIDGQGTHRYSTAAGRVLLRLGGPWRLAGRLLLLVPRPLRDAGYRLVVRCRYLFGRKETCRLPTADERARFLP